MIHKHVLLVGDDDKAIFSFDKRLGYVEDVVCNFGNTPSVAVTYIAFGDEIRLLQEEARNLGLKVGIYANLEKSKGYAEKVLGITDTPELRERAVVQG